MTPLCLKDLSAPLLLRSFSESITTWAGVPFLMKAGKGLDERLVEVRVRFRQQPYNRLFAESSGENSLPKGNELVMRVQPDEALFLKTLSKEPGLEQVARETVMEMQYKEEFGNMYVGDAYERMFLNAAKGDGSLFVSSPELIEAWRIFTPLLHKIDAEKPDVVLYPFGSRYPPDFDKWSVKHANVIQDAESWKEYLAQHGREFTELKRHFQEVAKDADGKVKLDDAVTLFKPIAQRVSVQAICVKRLTQIAAQCPRDENGCIGIDDYLKSAAALKRAFGTEEAHTDHTGW